MITIRKLKTLKEGTRLRKYIVILENFEKDLIDEKSVNYQYLKSVLNEIENEGVFPPRLNELIKENISYRNINSIRHIIMSYLSIEPSEWDFTSPKDNTSETKRYPISLYLDDIRSPFNLGSIFRTSECFGVSNIFLSKDTTNPDHKRAIRTSMGCIEKINWEVKSLNEIIKPVFALELGGTPINEFKFPSSGTAVIGSEELGVSPEALKLADSSLGRVSIPLSGGKSSLNVANATSILLYKWHEKLLES